MLLNPLIFRHEYKIVVFSSYTDGQKFFIPVSTKKIIDDVFVSTFMNQLLLPITVLNLIMSYSLTLSVCSAVATDNRYSSTVLVMD